MQILINITQKLNTFWLQQKRTPVADNFGHFIWQLPYRIVPPSLIVAVVRELVRYKVVDLI